LKTDRSHDKDGSCSADNTELKLPVMEQCLNTSVESLPIPVQYSTSGHPDLKAVLTDVVSEMPPVDEVLGLPELSTMILRLLPNADLARVGNTCSWWGGLALDVLWRKCSDPRPLFAMLSPLIDGGIVSFVRRFLPFFRGGDKMIILFLDAGEY
jgi:hypothetical protein